MITECRAETLPGSYSPTSHTNNAKLTCHGNCAANSPDASCKWHLYSYRRHGHLQGHGSVVTDSVSSGRDHSTHCWWDLIRSKQLSSGTVCHARVLAGFSGHGNSFYKCRLFCDENETIDHVISEYNKDKIWLGEKGNPRRTVQETEILPYFQMV